MADPFPPLIHPLGQRLMSAPVLEMHLRVPLDAFDLEIDCIATHRVIGIFGPSGAGKTTLLESIAGLHRATSGLLRCNGNTWLDSRKGIRTKTEARGIGYVPQDHLLFPHRKVQGNLEFGARRARREGHDFATIFREVVEVLELEPLLERKVDGLSGGERQRVALGRALCSGPRLLMLDEPLASLDSQLRHKILPYLLRVRDRFEVPVLIVSHNPVELLALCDDVIALRAGKIVAQGTPTEVLTRSDLYSTAAREGFENILPSTLVEHREHTSVVRLGNTEDGQLATIPRTEGTVGSPLTIGIPASDILVATHPVDGISARNCLQGTLTALQSIDHQMIIKVQLKGMPPPSVIIELTISAVEELHLAIGTPVWLLIKSSSIVVYR